MAKSKKEDLLNYYITDFAVEISYTAGKERYNKAWHKLWCRIHKLGLFNDIKNHTSK